MLHAFARNKSRAYSRYLGVRDADETRVSAEDEITSIVFGPLDFLPARDHWTLWTHVLRNHASVDTSGPLPADFIEGFAPTTCSCEFWPRRDGIEPDLLIGFADEQGNTRTLLVELKWDAPVSGADQLLKQWTRYQRGDHDRSLHVFIAKQMGDLPDDRRPWACADSGGHAASRLRGVRWHEFRHDIIRLGSQPDTPGPLARWCRLASGFLEQVNIRPFAGFHVPLHLAQAMQLPDRNAWRFWTPAPATTSA